jgi:hypothetical protein
MKSCFTGSGNRIKLSVLSNDTDSAETIVEKLGQYLARMNPITFAISCTSTSTSYYKLKGPWLLCLGLKPYVEYEIRYLKPLEVVLQTEGVQFVNLNCGLGRNVMSTQTSDMRLTGSDILWTIPLPSAPGTRTYYTNFSTGGKIVISSPVVETLEIYFTDKYNFPVLGFSDWTVVLTFDYTEKESRFQPVTSKDVRRIITSY